MTIKASRDGRFVFSGCADGSAKIFNLQSFQQVHHFQGIHESITIKREISSSCSSRIYKFDCFNA